MKQILKKYFFTTRGKYPELFYIPEFPVIYIACDKKNKIFNPIEVDGNALFSSMHPILIEKLNSKECEKPIYNQQKEKSVYKQNINELIVTAKELGISLDKENEENGLKRKTVLELRNEIKTKLAQTNI